jgi:hypothetical protein
MTGDYRPAGIACHDTRLCAAVRRQSFSSLKRLWERAEIDTDGVVKWQLRKDGWISLNKSKSKIIWVGPITGSMQD